MELLCRTYNMMAIPRALLLVLGAYYMNREEETALKMHRKYEVFYSSNYLQLTFVSSNNSIIL